MYMPCSHLAAFTAQHCPPKEVAYTAMITLIPCLQPASPHPSLELGRKGSNWNCLTLMATSAVSRLERSTSRFSSSSHTGSFVWQGSGIEAERVMRVQGGGDEVRRGCGGGRLPCWMRGGQG